MEEVQVQVKRGDVVERVFRVSGETTPVKIELLEEPVMGSRTVSGAEAYTGLVVKQYRKPWLVAEKVTLKRDGRALHGVAPVGAIVFFWYRTGSRKTTMGLWNAVFMVVGGEQGEVTVEPSIGEETLPLKVKNLRYLTNGLSADVLDEVEAEIVDKGWSLSLYDPVKALYYLWVKRNVAAAVEKKRRGAVEDVRVEEAKREAGGVTVTFTLLTPEDVDRAIRELRRLKRKMIKK